MKNFNTYALLAFLVFVVSICSGQWTSKVKPSFDGSVFYNNQDFVTLTYYDETSVGGDNNYQAFIFEGSNDIITSAPQIIEAFSSIPTENLLKATAGKPFEIALDFYLYYNNNLLSPSTVDNFVVNSDALMGGIGKNEQGYAYDEFITLERTSYSIQTNYSHFLYKKSFVFDVGRTQSWLVFGFATNEGGTIRHFTIIIPFVVEGPSIPISEANPVDIIGYFKEPAIPQLILHNPPGDMSTVSLQSTEEACRSISQSLANDQSNNGFIDITLGIAGSAGLFVTTKFEFSATLSASVGGGSSEVTSNGQQNCLTILNTISTAAGAAPANEGSIYMGYSSDVAYGLFPAVQISETVPKTVSKDTSIMFGVVEDSAAPFYYSKQDILNDMETKRIIANTSTIPKVKHEALNQVEIWKQVLEKDSININNPANELITPPFTITGKSGPNTSFKTLSVSTDDSYDVSHFLEVGVGASFVLKVAGSGVSGGFEFKTKKTLGQSVSNNNSTSTTIGYNLQDGDEGDEFKIKIVKDPTYGTPIFLLDEDGSKSSCPYEGGYRRDQPDVSADFNNCAFQMDQKNLYIDSIGESATAVFNLQLCNQSNEERDYNVGLYDNNNGAEVKIANTPVNSGQVYITEIIAAGSCENFILTIGRNPGLPLAGEVGYLPLYDVYDGLKIKMYPECFLETPNEISEATFNVTFGRDGGYALGDTDCDGISNINECQPTLDLNAGAGLLSGTYSAQNEIIVHGGAIFETGAEVMLSAPNIQFQGENNVPNTTIVSINTIGCAN